MVVDWNALRHTLPPDPTELSAENGRLRRDLDRANALLRIIPAHVVTEHVRRANGLPALSLARPQGGQS